MLAALGHKLPLENIEENAEVVGLFFRMKCDLSHEQKQEIYKEARRPTEVIGDRLKRLRDIRKDTYDPERVQHFDEKIYQLRCDSTKANQNAREEIFSRHNSAGRMGVGHSPLDEGIGSITFDFHGLHVGDMNIELEARVKPILPVVKKAMIITGRGSHSADGESKLVGLGEENRQARAQYSMGEDLWQSWCIEYHMGRKGLLKERKTG